jgi:hypothetical protein
MKRSPSSSIGFLAACVLLALQTVVAGESARNLVARGNTAYDEGRYDEALTLYDEASVTVPESPRVYFNRGAAQYRMEDYEAAEGAFKEAAVRAKDPALASRAKYNLGNCAFRNAQRQRDSDLKKAIEHCQESIAHYQEARDLDPNYTEAAENIEIVRLYVKVLLDEQKKKEEQQQQQHEQQENLVEKLQKLIARQKELMGGNEGLRGSHPDASDVPAMDAWKEDLKDLTGDQSTLRTDTGTVLDEMRQTAEQIRQQAAAGGSQGAPSQPGAPDASAFAEKIEQAAGHVVHAVDDEQKAETALNYEQLKPALDHQANAVQSLEEAVKALADEQQQDQQQQQSGDQNQDQQQQDQQQNQDGDQQDEQQQEDQQEGDQQQDQSQQDQPQESQDSEQEQERRAAEARAERADDILNEEKENQKQRQPVRPGRVRPVDKDW